MSTARTHAFFFWHCVFRSARFDATADWSADHSKLLSIGRLDVRCDRSVQSISRKPKTDHVDWTVGQKFSKTRHMRPANSLFSMTLQRSLPIWTDNFGLPSFIVLIINYLNDFAIKTLLLLTILIDLVWAFEFRRHLRRYNRQTT